MDMQVAILASGLATGLGELTRNRPKSMLEVRGKPFPEYQLEFLRRGGVRNVVVCAGHLAEQIETGNPLEQDKKMGKNSSSQNWQNILWGALMTILGIVCLVPFAAGYKTLGVINTMK